MTTPEAPKAIVPHNGAFLVGPDLSLSVNSCVRRETNALDLSDPADNLGCMGATKIITDFLSDSRPVS
jgi:hypothetical protein